MAELTGRLMGRYRLDALLGHGGMAEVYRATDTKLARTVAVKVILASYASDAQFLERFLREARLVASLDHPSILPIFDFGEDGGLPFLVMPYRDGGTLKERVGTPFPLALAASYIRQLAEALDAAHAAQILHRDVKPANVLLGRDDRLMLADFGIAKMLESTTGITATGMVIGTPIYMAPEQAQGKPASPATDRYALGVLAYELLSGAPPFAGETALSLLHQHVTMPAPILSSRVGGLPPVLDEVFQRALAKDPDRRPPTCRALADAVAALVPVSSGATASTVPWIRSQEQDETAPTLLPGVTAPLPADSPLRAEEDPGTAPTVLTLRKAGGLSGAHLASEVSGAQAAAPGAPGPFTRYRLPAAVALAAIVAGVLLLRGRKEDAPREVPLPPTAVPAMPPPSSRDTAAPVPPTAPAEPSPEPTTMSIVEHARPTAVPAAPRPATAVPPRVQARPTAAPTIAAAQPTEAAPVEVVAEPSREGASARGPLVELRDRIDPFGGTRPTAADYEAARDVARRVKERAPGREEARFIAAYAQGGLDYLAHRDQEARAALAESGRAARLGAGFREARRLVAFLRQAEAEGTLTPWELALAYGDARGEADALLAEASTRFPDSPRVLFGRALLRRIQGRDQDAIRDGLAVWGRRPASGIAEFLGDEHARVGKWADAVRWYQSAIDAARTGQGDIGYAAFEAGRISRDRLSLEDDAVRFFQLSCEAGVLKACRDAPDARGFGQRRRGRRVR